MTRKLIEQMLDCIEELKYSNDTFTSQFKSNAAITAARELLVDMAQPEQSDAMLACDVQPRPLQYPLSDYHVAMSEGPLHFTWTDKPHRLVYDLIAAVKYYAAPQPKAPEPLTDDERQGFIDAIADRDAIIKQLLAAQRSKE